MMYSQFGLMNAVNNKRCYFNFFFYIQMFRITIPRIKPIPRYFLMLLQPAARRQSHLYSPRARNADYSTNGVILNLDVW